METRALHLIITPLIPFWVCKNLPMLVFCLLSLEELAVDMTVELRGAAAGDGFPLPGTDDDILAEDGVGRADETEGVGNCGGLGLRGFYLGVGQPVDGQTDVEDLAVVVHVGVIPIVLVITAEIIHNERIVPYLCVIGDEPVSKGGDLYVIGPGPNQHRSTWRISQYGVNESVVVTSACRSIGVGGTYLACLRSIFPGIYFIRYGTVFLGLLICVIRYGFTFYPLAVFYKVLENRCHVFRGNVFFNSSFFSLYWHVMKLLNLILLSSLILNWLWFNMLGPCAK